MYREYENELIRVSIGCGVHDSFWIDSNTNVGRRKNVWLALFLPPGLALRVLIDVPRDT